MIDQIPSDKIILKETDPGVWHAIIWIKHSSGAHYCAASPDHKDLKDFGFHWSGDSPADAVRNLRRGVTMGCVEGFLPFPHKTLGMRTAAEHGL